MSGKFSNNESSHLSSVKNINSQSNKDAEITVVIACHDPKRPLTRAIRSVCNSDPSTKILLVAHNLDPRLIEHRLANTLNPTELDRLSVVNCQDGLNSPAGPFNLGLDLATTRYVSVMGSDDALAPGATTAWLNLAKYPGTEVVISRVSRGIEQKFKVHTPPTRPKHRPVANFVKDRLVYQAAPLGILEKRTLDRLSLRFTEGLITGEDIAFSARLYKHAQVRVQHTGPGYLIGEDGNNRVTFSPTDLENFLKHIPNLLSQPWFKDFSKAERLSLMAKTIRVSLFGMVIHAKPDYWTTDNRQALQRYTQMVIDAEPEVLQVLPIGDRNLLAALLDPTVSSEEMRSLLKKRRRFGVPRTLLTNPAYFIHREAPLRFMAASFLRS